ncbi:hypothetical protein [Aurantimonas sp. VKM B-3413]|uniref:hypothetical protein n=1 Tax=Aurantimonas sp. VKM B-3413 TaxID=2779401 RepID=UPI001E2D28F3|nr:hypothetical protein [Aurantimonas sp. VKM B-3413]MCB8838125.1 hypothetical protein [Aurantimonas sp. VKM B-3413]
MSNKNDRVHRLNRILKVQAQKRLLEEWRLNHLREERAELDRTDAELLASLGTGSQLHGLFIDVKVRTLRRNDVERRAIEQRKAAVEERIRSVRRVEKGVEKRRDQARRTADAETEAKERDASIDSFLARTGSSFE